MCCDRHTSVSLNVLFVFSFLLYEKDDNIFLGFLIINDSNAMSAIVLPANYTKTAHLYQCLGCVVCDTFTTLTELHYSQIPIRLAVDISNLMITSRQKQGLDMIGLYVNGFLGYGTYRSYLVY